MVSVDPDFQTSDDEFVLGLSELTTTAETAARP
jgi:hypothetical protein